MIRDRIKELRHVAADTLEEHPENWRLHGQDQRVLLDSVLAEIGYAGALIAREREDGKLELIDGHLRKDLADHDPVPVLVTDLTAEEARKVLSSYDLLSSLAGEDTAKLAAMVTGLQAGQPALEAYFRALETAGLTEALEANSEVPEALDGVRVMQFYLPQTIYDDVRETLVKLRDKYGSETLTDGFLEYVNAELEKP